MRLTSLLRRAALSAALVFAGASVAATLTDVTTLHARLANGAIETLRFEGDVAPGESRALTSDNGLAAVLSRGAEGLVLQLAGESFALPVPLDVDGDAAPGARQIFRVISRHDASDVEADVLVDSDDDVGDRFVAARGDDDASPRVEKRIVIKHRGAAEADAPVDAAVAIDPAELLAEGTGKRIVMLRTIERRVDATAQ